MRPSDSPISFTIFAVPSGLLSSTTRMSASGTEPRTAVRTAETFSRSL